MAVYLHGLFVKKKKKPLFFHSRKLMKLDVDKSLDSMFKSKGYRQKYSPQAIVNYAKW